MKTYPCTVQTNITFRNNRAIHKKHPGRNCCFVNFGGLISAFINNYGEGCGCASILDFRVMCRSCQILDEGFDLAVAF